MKWTDENIDKFFREQSENGSFEYKDAYWNEFENGLDSVITSIESVDEIYKEQVENYVPAYDPSFFDEFESLRSAQDVDAGVIQDNEVDTLYKSASDNISFVYRNAYWKDFQKNLPIRRRLDGAWFATASVFALLILTAGLITVPAQQVQRVAGYSLNDISAMQKSTSTQLIDKVPTIENSESFVAEYSQNNVTGIQETSETGVIEIPSHTLVVESQFANGSESMIDAIDRSFDSGEMTEANNINTVLPLENDNAVASEVVISNLDVLPLGLLTQNGISQNLESSSVLNDLQMPATRPSVYFELNGSLSQSLVSPSEEYFNTIGVGVGTQVHKGRLVFTAGLNGFISNHNDIVVSREYKMYHFGSDVVRDEFNFKQFYHLEANLGLGYKFGRHQVNIGVRPSYVVNSKVNYSHQQEFEADRNQVLYGYTEGIKLFGVKPYVGYGVDIFNGWSAGVNFGTQLLPSLENTAINGVNNNFPIDGQLYIRKSINIK